jgi:YD repeat-containing protein
MLRCAVSILAVCLTTALVAYAGEGYFGYDEFGRINRSFDEQNRVTDYSYDEAGNIVGIRTTVSGTAPTITSITPNSLRRGESKVIQVTGTNLLGVNISSPDPGLVVSNVGTMQSTDTQVTFTLTANADAIRGTQQLTFANSAGSTTAPVTINPVLPTIYTMPGPLAAPPDSVERQFMVRLSNADNVTHSFTVTVADSTIATIAATTATIPAGAMEAQIAITGLKTGQTAITFDSDTLDQTTFIAYVTTEYQEMNKARSALVGVVVQEVPPPTPSVTYSPMSAPHVGVLIEEPAQASAPATYSPIVAPIVGVTVQEISSDPAPSSVSSLMAPFVGVALGGVVTNMTPTSASAGQTVTLSVGGNALGNATAVRFLPDTSVTPGIPSIAPDGTSLIVEVVIAADAPQTVRRVKVLAGTEELPTSDESITQFQIAP